MRIRVLEKWTENDENKKSLSLLIKSSKFTLLEKKSVTRISFKLSVRSLFRKVSIFKVRDKISFP